MSTPPEDPRLAEVAHRLEECFAILERKSGRRPWRVPAQDNVDGAYPYYGEEDGRLFVRAQERGQLVRDEPHDDVEGVVESLVTGAAVEVATAYEVRHRRAQEDSRRQWFHLSELWLAEVEPAWGDRLHAQHMQVLSVAPFDDDRWREVEVAPRVHAQEMDARRVAAGPEPQRAEPGPDVPGRHVRAVPSPLVGAAPSVTPAPVRHTRRSAWVLWLVAVATGFALCALLRLVGTALDVLR